MPSWKARGQSLFHHTPDEAFPAALLLCREGFKIIMTAGIAYTININVRNSFKVFGHHPCKVILPSPQPARVALMPHRGLSISMKKRRVPIYVR